MKFKHLVILFVMFGVFNIAHAATDCTATGTTGIPQTECEALIAIYNSTGGANWTTKTNWNTNTAVSTWSGVTLTSSPVHVRTLSLGSNNLVGTLPTEIGNLPSLTQLNIHLNPGLTGSVPASIVNLTNLIVLNFYSDNLTGSIPANIINLNKMMYLNLNVNHLSGTIPNFYNVRLNDPAGIVNISANDFTFGDLEANLSTLNRAGFTYALQNTVDTVRSISFAEGDTMVITPSVAVNTNDSYQWYKNGTLISGATSRIYTKTFHEADSAVYTYRITNSVITGTTLQSANITVPTVTPNPPTPDSIYYSLSGNTLWVRGSISSTKDVAESYLLQGTPSNTFMTERRYLLNNTAYNSNSSYTSGTFLSNSTDDVTPIGTKNVGFLSANHGVNSPVVTSTGHDKTNADIDSVWQDSSGHQFLIASISGNAITFNSIPSGSPWVMYSSVAAGSLTHVSGATHTSNIVVTSQVAVQQYSVVKNIVRHALKNGTTEFASGDAGYANYVDFSEELDLIDPSTVNRTNNPFVWNDAQVWMHVVNNYRMTAGTMTIHTTYNIVRPMNVGYLGIIQTNAPITPAYDHTYFYIPKTKTNGGYDFKSTQLFDSAPVSPVYFDSTHVDNINNPPNREIIFKKRNVDSNYDIGFAFGYGPYGSTSAENRNCFTTGNPCWTVYTSQKTYPQMVGNNGVINNVTYDAYAYRQWIDPKQYDIGKTAYWNNQNNRDLVYMDFHRSANNDVTTLPSKFIGKAVKIIESENINTPASIIPSDGNLMLSTTSDNNYNGNTYGFIVLELTDAQSGITSSIPEGVYHQTQQVSLSAAGSDYIRYSATGSLSSCSDGTLYSGPIDILSSQTIYARACNSFGNFSNSSFSYVISIPVHSGGHPPMQMINPINVIKMDSSNGASQIIPEKNIEIVHNTPEIQNIKKDLKVGSKNNDVKTLQQFLIDQNKGSKAKALKKNGVTNYFGNDTKQALIEWQKANKISVTGVLDTKTKNKIKKILK